MSKNKSEILQLLRQYCHAGEYSAAIRACLGEKALLTVPSSIRTSIDALIQCQLAMALQHAGQFAGALDMYRRVAQSCVSMRGPKAKEILYNVCVQEAVLLERLGSPLVALSVLDEIGPPGVVRDMRFARATLASWIDITRLRAFMLLGKYSEVAHIASRHLDHGDWNQRLWARLYIELLAGCRRRRTEVELGKSCSSIDQIIAEMDVADPPCVPWFAMIAGRHLMKLYPNIGIHYLHLAEQSSAAFRKFFVIAEACEHLYSALTRLRRKEEADRALGRSVAAYARCRLLLTSPFRERLCRAAHRAWGKKHAVSVFLKCERLAELPDNPAFSQMCKFHAARGRLPGAATGAAAVHSDELQPWRVFEEFVRDWAPTRYVGKVIHVDPGFETADLLIVDKGRATVVQAKHVLNPAQSLPTRLYLRSVAEHYNVTVSRYALVISTSHPDGWKDTMWHAQHSERVRQLVPDTSIVVDVVTEPELQNAVLLNDWLYGRYFADCHSTG